MSIRTHRPHHRLGSLALGLALAAAALAACGPQQPAASPEAAPAEAPAEAGGDPGPSAPPGEEATSAEVHFDEMSHEEKLTFMGTVVMPRMKPLFAAHEEHEHAEGEKKEGHEEHEFGCASCHGKNMRDVGFKMPNSLMALPAENTVQAAMEMNEESAKFMLEQVVPTMAELLGEKAAEGGVGEGFGCFNCHQKE